MQNVDKPKSQIITADEENLELAATTECPVPLDSQQDSKAVTADLEGIQSEPEISSKLKTRSRFSAAFRKLSKSTRKKQNPLLLKETPGFEATLSETIVSSGTEEPTSTSTAEVEAKPKKKKSKLSKRFLLSSLKRSKTSIKKSTDEEEELTITQSAEEATLTPKSLENLETFSQLQRSSAIPNLSKDTRPSLVSDLTASGSLQRLDRIRKVQITIRGKKIEHTQSSDNVNPQQFSVQTTSISDENSKKTSSSADKDYLTPTAEDLPKELPTTVESATFKEEETPSPTTSPIKGTVTDTTKAKKKKIKSKKIVNTKQTSKITTTTNSKITQTHTTVSASIAVAAASSTTPTEEKFVITQSGRDTPPREQAPAKPSRVVAAVVPTSQSATSTGTIRKPTIRAAATQSTHTERTEVKVTAKPVLKIITDQPYTETESDLMHNPQGGIERGHRFPRPITPTTTLEPSAIENEILQPATATTTNPQQRQRQIKFQLQSLTSQTLSLPTPPTTISVDDDAEQPPSSLQPPSQPPPPIPNASPTPDTRSQEHRRHSPLPSDQLYLATRILPEATKSVASEHNSDLDEPISSAESAQHQDSDFYSGNNIRNPNTAGHSLSQDSQRTLKAEDSIETNKSSDSQSPVSESSSRRRIRYVAQPTLYDDYDRVESRREALSYLYSAVSDYSLDSEPDDSQMPAFGDLTMEQEEPPIMTTTAEKREHLYKILVIGELGTGKTSFIKRYVHQFFSQNYRATIGVDFALKVLHWDANTIVRLQLWDIAGQERFGNMTRVYYKEAVGAFIVFDVTRSGTFDCVSKWKEDLDSKVQLPDGSPIPCILLANKCDQDKQGIVATPEKIDEYVRENGFAGWFETSAKENINIDEAARALVNKILLNDKLISAADLADSEKFNLNNSADQTVTESKSKCSC